MRAHLKRTLIGIKGSLWIQPSVMMAAAVALGLLLPELDRRQFGSGQPRHAWGHWVAMSADGARATLATAANALASILAIAVTATMVVIQLAAATYTSRLLRRFLEDRPIRIFLGAFAGSVLYLVVVLGAIRSAEEGAQFVPLVSVLVGRLLTAGCLVVLIVYVYYTARSVQAATIVERVVGDALRSFRNERETHGRDTPPLQRQPPDTPGSVIAAEHTGYLQVVDFDQLAAALPPTVTVARVELGPGDFSMPSTPLVTLWSSADGARPQPLPADAEARLRAAFATGRERTVEQDPGFAIRQLTDIAVKALSPGVNDPTTAVMVVNELGVLAHHTLKAGELGGWRGLRLGGRDLWFQAFGLCTVLTTVFDWWDPVAVLAVAGLSLALALWIQRGRLLAPAFDPRFGEAVRYESW